VLPGLLRQFPDRRVVQVLFHHPVVRARPGLHESPRQCPLAGVGRNAALHQQHIKRAVADRQRHNIHGDPERVKRPRVIAGEVLLVTGRIAHQVLLTLRYS
jgi:hypothetical protein